MPLLFSPTLLDAALEALPFVGIGHLSAEGERMLHGSRPNQEGRGRTCLPDSRKGENPRMWFRAERIFRERDEWWISTREGIPVGPYETEELARRDAKRLIEILAETIGPIDAAVAIREFRDRPKR